MRGISLHALLLVLSFGSALFIEEKFAAPAAALDATTWLDDAGDAFHELAALGEKKVAMKTEYKSILVGKKQHHKKCMKADGHMCGRRWHWRRWDRYGRRYPLKQHSWLMRHSRHFRGGYADFKGKLMKLKYRCDKKEQYRLKHWHQLPADELAQWQKWTQTEKGRKIVIKREKQRKWFDSWLGDWFRFGGSDDAFKQKLTYEVTEWSKKREMTRVTWMKKHDWPRRWGWGAQHLGWHQQRKFYRFCRKFKGSQQLFKEKLFKMKKTWLSSEKWRSGYLKRYAEEDVEKWQQWRSSDKGRKAWAHRIYAKKQIEKWFQDWFDFHGSDAMFKQKMQYQLSEWKVQSKHWHKRRHHHHHHQQLEHHFDHDHDHDFFDHDFFGHDFEHDHEHHEHLDQDQPLFYAKTMKVGAPLN